MKIIGVEPTSFLGSNGEQINGYNVSFSQQISDGQGVGLHAERAFVLEARLKTWGIDIMKSVGHEAKVFFAKGGKVVGMVVS